MAKNKPANRHIEDRPVYDWRADAIREWEQGAMTRAVAVLLGILEPLPYETITGVDRSYAQHWCETFRQRGQEAQQREERRQARLDRYGRVGATAGRLDY